MIPLSNVPTPELLAELERRNKKQAAQELKELDQPDFSMLLQIIRECTKASLEKGYEDENFREYIYEAALGAVYGKSYWDWKRKQGW